MKRLIRKMLIGDTAFSDYSKITVPAEIGEKVHLEGSDCIRDISGSHWLLCIEPLIFGCWLPDDVNFQSAEKNLPRQEREYRIHFGRAASLSLDFMDCVQEKEGVLLLLRLRTCSLRHLDRIRTWLLYFRYYRRDGMNFTRFRSFVAAYSYPRRVRLVSFRQDDYYNIFPMDLLGDIPLSNRYVFGLRHSNRALARILATGKLVVSEVPSRYKDIIYQLGKHHSGSPPSPDALPFDTIRSRNFECHIPSWTQSCKEICISKSLDLGSHMLLWGETIDEQVLTDPGHHLYIVHFLHFLYQKNKGTGYTIA